MQDQTIISQLLQQNKLLMDMMCTMQTEILEMKAMMVHQEKKPDAKSVLREILQPAPPSAKLTKKEQIALAAKALSAKRALEAIRKQNAKKLS